MDKTTFLAELENALEGEVSGAVIADTIRYYSQYIADEVRAGRSEEDVLRTLGSGNVIAKTVIASQTAGDARQERAYARAREDATRQADPERGLHMHMDSDGNVDVKYGTFRLNSWYGKLLGILILIAVIALIILLVAGLFSLLWMLLPFLVVGFLVITLIRFFIE